MKFVRKNILANSELMKEIEFANLQRIRKLNINNRVEGSSVSESTLSDSKSGEGSNETPLVFSQIEGGIR